jgi:glycosyltransferase involved in cell wall biosynthesis
MLLKFRERRYINSNIKVNIDTLYQNLQNIRSQSETILITPMPTGNSWRGIYNGAIAFFPDSTFAVPQYFSDPVYTVKELKLISDEIINLGFRKIIFSGYPPYFNLFIKLINESIKQNRKNVDVYIIYHGSLASNSEDNITGKILKEILELNKTGLVKKIGFVKKGMSETLKKTVGIETYYLIPMTIPTEYKGFNKNINSSELNLGVLTHNQYRKNIHNQVAAALMFENSKVHIHEKYEFDYLFNNYRLFVHPFFESYSDFLQLLGSMTLNFYVTFSECFGLVITESLSLGVPCMASYNSGIFDYDDYLKEMLIVKDYDNSEAIYKQAELVLASRQKISERGIKYIKELNKIAKEKLLNFIDF